MPTYVASRYNHALEVGAETLLFNARTGACMRLAGADARSFAHRVSDRPGAHLALSKLPRGLARACKEGGFLVESKLDELRRIRETYWRARASAPIVLTVTVTMDCNLGCFYCYEERSEDRLLPSSVGQIVALATDRLRRSGKSSLHVDWYGGEPMLNVELIEAASGALRELCVQRGVAYSASIISNGTRWPSDAGAFVERHKIRQVQLSFDGMHVNHQRRRRPRASSSPREQTFAQTAALVDRLLDHVRVDLRFNTDRANREDLPRFIEFARRRGWFERAYPAVLQPARLSGYSERSRFMRKTELSLDEFDALRADVRAFVVPGMKIEESEAPESHAAPKTHVCAALAGDSDVIGADGRLYRCGLQVSEPERAVGQLAAPTKRRLPLAGDDHVFWRDFDPTRAPSCARCSFLPLCWGGCPKRHLEQDAHAMAEQGRYWRKNLPRLIANRFGLVSTLEYGEEQQFREV